MKWSKEKIIRFHNTLSFWNYASINNIRCKIEWKYSDLLINETKFCTFCSFFLIEKKTNIDLLFCTKCPLYRKEGEHCISGPCVYPAYDKWCNDTTKNRKIYAKKIRDAIKTWMINEHFYDESLLVEKEKENGKT
jgi:hypothetical protein